MVIKVKFGRKSRKINGITYYVDNFYWSRSSALKQEDKLKGEGYLTKVKIDEIDKKGRAIYVVLKRHKKHPRLFGLLG